MGRKIMDSYTFSENGTTYTASTNSPKGLDTNIFLQIGILGAKDTSDSNTIEVVLQATPNPGDSALWFDEEDRAAFPVVIYGEDEAEAGILKMIHIKGDYGQIRLKITRAGAGTTTFQLSSWVEP